MSIQAAQLVASVQASGVDETMAALQGVGSAADEALTQFASLAAGAARMSTDVAMSGEEASSGFLGGIGDMAGGLLDFGSKIGMTIFSMQALGQMAVSVGQNLLGPAISAQQMSMTFNTLMGSTKAAKDMLAQLVDFANNKTPFKAIDIEQLAAKMMGFGINSKNVIPYLQAIGDNLSAIGQATPSQMQMIVDIFGKMNNEGKLSVGIMTELSRDGIDAWGALERATGKTHAQLQQMIAKGLIPANDAMNLLTQGIEKNPIYKGQMANQMGTMGGLLSTLSSVWNTLMVDFGSPVIASLQGSLGNLNNLLGSSSFQSFATGAGQGIANVFGSIAKFAQSAMGPISQVAPGILSLGKSISGDLMPSFQNLQKIVGGQLGQNFQLFGKTVQQVGQWFQTSMLPAIQQAMPGFQRLASVVVSNIIPALAQIWAVGQQVGRQVMPLLIQAFEAIAPVVVRVGGFLANNLAQALKFLAPFAVQAAQALGQFASDIISRVVPIVQQLWNGISAFLNWIKPYWPAIWSSIQTVFASTWDTIKGVVQIAWAIVSGIIKVGLDVLSGNWKQAWNDIKAMFSGVWDGIKSIAQGAWNLVQAPIMNGLHALQNNWNTTWNTIKTIFGNAWSGMQGLVSGAWSSIAGSVKGGINNVIGMINGFINGLDSMHISLPGGGSVGFSIPDIPYLASGGMIAQGGFAIVGERGPETVWLPAGAQVIPNSGGQPAQQQPDIHVYVALDGANVAYKLMPHIVSHVRYGVGAKF